jgi:isocitrate lyase
MEIAVRKELEASGKASAFEEYRAMAVGKSNSEARAAARQILGKDVFWDWDCKPYSLH